MRPPIKNISKVKPSNSSSRTLCSCQAGCAASTNKLQRTINNGAVVLLRHFLAERAKRGTVQYAVKPATNTAPATAMRPPGKDKKPIRANSQTPRSEEHTSELQSRPHLVCRLLLEKKKNKKINTTPHTTRTKKC